MPSTFFPPLLLLFVPHPSICPPSSISASLPLSLSHLLHQFVHPSIYLSLYSSFPSILDIHLLFVSLSFRSYTKHYIINLPKSLHTLLIAALGKAALLYISYLLSCSSEKDETKSLKIYKARSDQLKLLKLAYCYSRNLL